MEYDPLTNEDEHDLWLQSRKALKHKHARKTDPYILPDNSLIDSDDDMIWFVIMLFKALMSLYKLLQYVHSR